MATYCNQHFVLWHFFATWQQKKRVVESNKGKFGILKNKLPYLEEKKTKSHQI
jgi:hypothetical protein